MAEREYPAAPLLGVGVVLLGGPAAAPRTDPRVLLIQRRRPPLVGYWSVPGGLVELGESVRAAALRETAEETGLHVEIGPLVEIAERLQFDEQGRIRYHYVILDFLARLLPGRPGDPRPASDAAAARWFDWEALDRLPLTPGLMPVLERARIIMNSGSEFVFRGDAPAAHP